MLKTIAPQFLVADLRAAIAYYTDVLGFEQKIGYEDFYASVARDSAEIHLKCAAEFPGVRSHRLEKGHVDALIGVDNAAALFDEVSARGARIHQALASQPWGTRDFQVLDPDDHVICFMQDA